MSAALIDPVTADYVVQAGIPVRDPANGLANAVYLRLTTPLGSYWADPTLGSRLHELRRYKDVPRAAVLAKQYAEQALQPILDDGRASAIDVQAVQPMTGGLYLTVEVTAASGHTFTLTVKVI